VRSAVRSSIAQNVFCHGTCLVHQKVDAEQLSETRRDKPWRDLAEDFTRMSRQSAGLSSKMFASLHPMFARQGCDSAFQLCLHPGRLSQN
jgi:hypothetical protein